jgi:hypothetical protein
MISFTSFCCDAQKKLDVRNMPCRIELVAGAPFKEVVEGAADY